MGVGLQLFTVTGEEVLAGLAEDHVVEWVLEEATEYRLRAASGSLTSAHLDRLPLSLIDGNTARLYIGFWTSTARALRLEVGGQRVERRVRVVPARDKLDGQAWTRMLTDLERWLPAIGVGASGGTAGGLDAGGAASAGFTAVALLPLVPALMAALRSITASPRERTVEHVEHVPLRAIRRAVPSALAWLSRHPRAAAAMDAWGSLERSGPEPTLPRVAAFEDTHHPVNRYVAWAIARASKCLRQLAGRLEKVAGAGGSTLQADVAQWCKARAAAAAAAERDLRERTERSFLRRIDPAPASEAAMLALRDDPVYSRFHRVIRPFLAPRYAADAPDEQAPARPSYELYELWTFLAVVRGLAATRPAWTQTWHHTAAPDFSGGMGRGSRVELLDGGERLEVWFNRRFASFFAGDHGGPHSISGERYPDMVVAHHRADGQRRWLVLDAKYRVSRRNLADAFESVHIYRDALRWPAMGGRCAAGWLLVPEVRDETATWFSDEFRQEHGCGCFRLRPGEEGDAAAVARAVWVALASRCEHGLWCVQCGAST